jgi:three-Cys-motif partner protein
VERIPAVGCEGDGGVSGNIREWGFWTERKLAILDGYLSGFLTASSRVPHRLYIDTHAGQGDAVSKHDGVAIKTSALIAKDALDNARERGFEQLIFIELSHADQLAENVGADTDPRISIHSGNCHEVLPTILDGLKRADRKHLFVPTVVFLDPDGVKDSKWATMKAVAEFKSGKRPDGKPTQKAELYFLFSDQGAARILMKDLSKSPASAVEGVTDAFGTEDWREIHARYAREEIDYHHFAAELVNLMRWRIQTVLGYEYTHALPFVNKTNREVYHMIFATDNEAGSRIIGHLYRKEAERIPELRQAALDRESGQITLDLGVPTVEGPADRSKLRYSHVPPWDPFEAANA